MRFIIATYAWFLATLPEAFARANAWALSWLLWGLRRKIILRNLAASFPDKDRAWVRRIGRLSCRRTAEMGLYAIASPRLSEAEVRARTQIHPDVLNGPHSLRVPSGQVLFVPHFTLMEMMSAVKLIDADLGRLDWVTLYRPLDLAAAEVWVKASRERFGMRLVSRRDGFGQTMQAVRNGQVAIILFDQSTHLGAQMEFLGRPVATTDLPGIIAQRFKVPARVFWAERTGFWRCQLRSHALTATDSVGLTLESNAWLAARLRSSDDACADWLWAHDRWKHGRAPGIKPLSA
jgi:lauroyl/myristoyl acyltransferase